MKYLFITVLTAACLFCTPAFAAAGETVSSTETAETSATSETTEPAETAEAPERNTATEVMEIHDGEFDIEQLIRIAIDNQKYSYAPYSEYNVSAAVLMDSGIVYKGVNVENASYPAGICAERNAIFDAIECGERKIVAIAIVGGPNYTIKDYCAPCGICRQVMREFCDPKEMRVIFAKTETDYKNMSLEELLPESFGPKALEV